MDSQEEEFQHGYLSDSSEEEKEFDESESDESDEVPAVLRDEPEFNQLMQQESLQQEENCKQTELIDAIHAIIGEKLEKNPSASKKIENFADLDLVEEFDEEEEIYSRTSEAKELLKNQHELFKIHEDDSDVVKEKKLSLQKVLKNLESNNKLVGRNKSHFEIIGPPKKGGQGVVNKVVEKTEFEDHKNADNTYGGKKIKAIKTIEFLLKELNTLEIEILGQNIHNCLISAEKAFFEYDENTDIYTLNLIMPWMSHTLTTWVQPNPNKRSLEEVRYILTQVLVGIVIIHQRRLVHMDLKPDNILIDEEFDENLEMMISKSYICDFGYTKNLVSKSLRLGSTRGFVAPEICDQDIPKFTKKADIYSFGAILRSIFVSGKGEDAITTENIKQTIKQTFNWQESEVSESFASNLKQIVTNCLQKDRKKRPTAAELLENSFFQTKFPNKATPDSSIIQGLILSRKTKLISELKHFLDEKIGKTQISNWKLIYRGTRDGFEAKDFHAKCDNHPNTLTITRAPNGSILGGFTTQKWNPVKDKLVADEKAFIFTLYNSDAKYSPPQFFLPKIELKAAILCTDISGPSFGLCDLIFRSSHFHVHWGKSYEGLKSNSKEGSTFLCYPYEFYPVELEVCALNPVVKDFVENDSGFSSILPFSFQNAPTTTQAGLLSIDAACDSFQILKSFVEESIGPTNLLNWKLVYRATRDGFFAETFHRKCDTCPRSLAVIKSTDGSIFGGFTTHKWGEKGDTYIGSITDPQAFTFSLYCSSKPNKKPQIFKQSENTLCSILTSPDHGPCFGNGIMVLDRSNTKWGNSATNLRYSFEVEGGQAQIDEYMIALKSVLNEKGDNITINDLPEFEEAENNIFFLCPSYFFRAAEIEVYTM